jgi:DUF1365 family protein
MSHAGPASLKSALYFGRVRHARYQPKKHRLNYAVFSGLFDVDEIDAGLEARALRLMSVNRFNLFSVHHKDHGAKDGSALRPFIEEVLAARALPAPDQILMMCYPRLLGWVFNPITAYYCLYTDGAAPRIGAMIYEVRNTFGEDHIYVACLDGQSTETANLHSRDKVFHVSPFIGMAAQYHFSTGLPDETMRLVIRETEAEAPLLIASFTGTRRALSDANLVRAFLKYPLMTVKVLIAIHYEAGKLIFKGVSLKKRPSPPETRISY